MLFVCFELDDLIDSYDDIDVAIKLHHQVKHMVTNQAETERIESIE